jgi:hypothetical protein
MRHVAASLLLLLLACACSSPIYRQPTAEELANADYGQPPVDYEERVKALALVRYRDRSVAAVQVGTPRRSWYGELGRLTKGRDVHYGWGVPFRGYRLGFAALEAFVVQGTVFFRDGDVEAIEDDKGFEFMKK